MRTRPRDLATELADLEPQVVALPLDAARRKACEIITSLAGMV
jgi:hypothetical protein